MAGLVPASIIALKHGPFIWALACFFLIWVSFALRAPILSPSAHHRHVVSQRVDSASPKSKPSKKSRSQQGPLKSSVGLPARPMKALVPDLRVLLSGYHRSGI